MTAKPHILWVDDELELLKPHFLFLEQKGYLVTGALSGSDALDLIDDNQFDAILLDENMPGLSGIDTLMQISAKRSEIPVIMVTKSEEEDLMEKAIASKISDFLIKPINPHQLLLSLKKILHRNLIMEQATLSGYREVSAQLMSSLSLSLTINEWKDLYSNLMRWVIDIDKYSPEIKEMFLMQYKEAELLFARYIKNQYKTWLKDPAQRPIMSPDLFPKKIFPMLEAGERLFFILIDNFRLDQWLAVKEFLSEDFYIRHEELYLSILPTATQYARNAIFSGLMPVDIERMFPHLWVDEESEEGKNLNEAPLIQNLLDRYRKKFSFSYHKVNETQFGERLLNRMDQLAEHPLNVFVLNFVDMLCHGRTESKMIRELAHDEPAYRSLTRSWFKHSTTLRIFQKIAQMGYKIVLTTDHGCVRVQNPVRIIGEKNTSTNLRYKLGKNLSYNAKEVFSIDKPKEYGLPEKHFSDRFVFCSEDHFFAYPNNYNYYVSYYKDTFQHGGISLEEMLIPYIVLDPKGGK